MRISKILFVVAVALLGGACSSRTSKVGPDGDNVPSAEEGRDLKDINFSYDSYTLDSGSKSVLNANAAWLKANPDKKVQIEGHCDERGTNEYNMALGANRARAAQDYLRTLGIEASRVSVVSYGEELPLDTSDTEASWAKNRRDHFNVN